MIAITTSNHIWLTADDLHSTILIDQSTNLISHIMLSRHFPVRACWKLQLERMNTQENNRFNGWLHWMKTVRKIPTGYYILFTICQCHDIHGGDTDTPRNNFPKGNVIKCSIIISGMAVKDTIHISTFQNRISINWKKKTHNWNLLRSKFAPTQASKHTVQIWVRLLIYKNPLL